MSYTSISDSLSLDTFTTSIYKYTRVLTWGKERMLWSQMSREHTVLVKSVLKVINFISGKQTSLKAARSTQSRATRSQEEMGLHTVASSWALYMRLCLKKVFLPREMMCGSGNDHLGAPTLCCLAPGEWGALPLMSRWTMPCSWRTLIAVLICFEYSRMTCSWSPSLDTSSSVPSSQYSMKMYISSCRRNERQPCVYTDTKWRIWNTS